jgi:hypothetical protein
VHHESFLGLAGKNFAESPIDATHTFLDHLHLRFAFRSVGDEHQGLKGVANVVIREIDQVKVFAQPTRLLAFVQMKDGSGNQTSEQVVDYTAGSLKPKV